MDDDHSTRRPTPEAIRDHVRAEDPSTWGARDLSHTTLTSHAREGSTTTGAPAAASGPVVTDPTPATYTGARAYAGESAGYAGETPAATAAATTHRSGTFVEERGRVAHAEPPVERRRFSLGATFLGWAVAAFFTLVFSTIGLALVGGSALNDDGRLTFSDANGIVVGSLAVYLVAAFLAYVIGGYAAGRIALWSGVKHGLGAVAWAVLFALVAVFAGAYLADAFNVQNYLAGFDLGDVTAQTGLAIALALAAMLAGAALGGKLGERYHDRVHGIQRSTHRTGRLRGRPL